MWFRTIKLFFPFSSTNHFFFCSFWLLFVVPSLIFCLSFILVNWSTFWIFKHSHINALSRCFYNSGFFKTLLDAIFSVINRRGKFFPYNGRIFHFTEKADKFFFINFCNKIAKKNKIFEKNSKKKTKIF
jgi:hypothetical protein